MQANSRIAFGLLLITGLLASRPTAAQSDCTSQPDGTPCDDGNPCTMDDRCASGICIAPVQFTQPAGSPIAVSGYPLDLEAADVNLDGKPDLIVLNYNADAFTVLLGNGTGGFSLAPGSPVTSHRPQSLVVADFNVDGKPDVAMDEPSGADTFLPVFLGNGAGGFFRVAVPTFLAGQMVLLGAGDFNLDGAPDLVTVGERRLWVMLGNGAGGFTMAPYSPITVARGTGDGLVGDFNLDGPPDVAFTTHGANVNIYLGDGHGRLVPHPDSPVGTGSSSEVTAGDLNRDGTPDLVAIGQVAVSVLTGDGSGGFVAAGVLTGSYLIDAGVGDFSRDGKPDIAVLNYATDRFTILIGDGTGAAGGFAEVTDPSWGGLNAAVSLPVADFNLDGRPDLAVGTPASVFIFLNDVGAADGTGCFDGNACTTGDTCSGGTCVGGPASSCDDDDSCTNDACDPSSGCVHTPACADGNACTADLCDPTTGCDYELVNCDDFDHCNGPESCDPATGCVSLAPVVCAPPGACQMAGICDPATGSCSYGTKPNGAACDDGNPSTSPDTCQNGSCAGPVCTPDNNPKAKGWFKHLCSQESYQGDAITDADAACVGVLTDTFAGFTTKIDVCHVLGSDHDHIDDWSRSACSRAEDQLMTLALNICRQRVCLDQGIDSECDQGGNEETLAFSHNHSPGVGEDDDDDNPDGSTGTVGGSLDAADGILSNPGRTNPECQVAGCLAREINNGHALELASLVARREGADVRLTWLAPTLGEGAATPSSYIIWRRESVSTAPFVQIGSTPDVTYVDATAGIASWEYEVTAVYPELP